MVLAWLPRRSTPSVKMPRMKLERLSNLPTAMRLRGPLYVVPAEATLATSSVRDCSVAQPDIRATPPSSTTPAATLWRADLRGMASGSRLCQKSRERHSSAQTCFDAMGLCVKACAHSRREPPPPVLQGSTTARHLAPVTHSRSALAYLAYSSLFPYTSGP